MTSDSVGESGSCETGRFAVEQAKLLSFVAKMAVAIRMNSPYSAVHQDCSTAPTDVMWLADSLHNFDVLGRAIEAGKSDGITFACNHLIEMYEDYLQDGNPSRPNPARASFSRWGHLVDLGEALEIFQAIKAKAA